MDRILIETVDVDEGFPIKPCPVCKHPFGEHYAAISNDPTRGECEHCARRGERCTVDQAEAWPDLVGKYKSA